MVRTLSRVGLPVVAFVSAPGLRRFRVSTGSGVSLNSYNGAVTIAVNALPPSAPAEHGTVASGVAPVVRGV